MLILNNHNKRVLSVLAFWGVISFSLISVGFLAYRATTVVPNTSMSVLGEALRFTLPAVLAIILFFTSQRLYRSIGSNEPFFNFFYTAVSGAKSLEHDYRGEDRQREYMDAYANGEVDPSMLSPDMLEAVENREVINPDDVFTPQAENSKIIQRVRRVLEDDTVLNVSSSSVEFGEPTDTEPAKFAIRADKAGGLSDEKLIERLTDRILKSIPDGKILWSMTPDSVNDRIWFEKKTPFPGIIVPPIPQRVVKDLKDAKALYDSYRLVVGVDAFRNEIELNLTKTPHGLVIGGSGSGKSVFNRGLMEHMRSQGWQIVLCDGKRSDFVSMVNVPNVIAVGKNTEDWIRLTKFVLDQTTARYNRAQERQRKGITPSFDQPPMLFLLDEFGSIVRDVEESYGKAGKEAFFNYLKSIAAKARQAKIHMIIATQEIYAETLPGNLKSNLSFVISLGVPGANTLRDAFAKSLTSDAVRIGQSIRKVDKGRGIIQVEPDGEAPSIVEFQTYYGYSPGDPDGIPKNFPEVTGPWTEYKEKVSDKIPLLYPRMWWEEPEPSEVEAIESVDELCEYRMVTIQKRDGTIDPDLVHWDRNADEYVGNIIDESAEKVAGFDDDID